MIVFFEAQTFYKHEMSTLIFWIDCSINSDVAWLLKLILSLLFYEIK